MMTAVVHGCARSGANSSASAATATTAKGGARSATEAAGPAYPVAATITAAEYTYLPLCAKTGSSSSGNGNKKRAI